MVAGKTVLASATEVGARLGPTPGETLVLCGHTHIPRAVRLPDGRLIVNPGSVGLPAYSDDAPPHVVETGSSDARYAIVRRAAREWAVEFVCVPYDWRVAGAAARAAGWDDWARNVETGYG